MKYLKYFEINENINNEKLTIILNHKKGQIQIEDDWGDILGEFEFEPLNDGSINTDYSDIEKTLSHYFNDGGVLVNVILKFISYDGKELTDLEFEDNISTFNDLIKFIEEGEKEFDAFLN